jgi:hypothetical protein
MVNAYQQFDDPGPLFSEAHSPPTAAPQEDAKRTIQERFEDFHARHPEVYEQIVHYAMMVKRAGHLRYSIDACIQRVRWHFQFEHSSRFDFKINDHFSSRYARLVMDREPSLEGFFETRGLKAD